MFLSIFCLAVYEAVTARLRRLRTVNIGALVIIYLTVYAVLVAAWALRVPVLEAPGVWFFGGDR